ncbi:MAG: DUF2207 domain-containing protein, partial [Bacteroidota bacterium]
MIKKMILLLSGIMLGAMLFAGSGTINFVETTVELNKDGTAKVTYIVQWKVLSGELHGFYFNGNEKLYIPSFTETWAEDEAGNNYGLDITKVSDDKWDIILADGKGIGKGNVTFHFSFVTDFKKASYVGYTTCDDSTELVYF